MRARSHILIAAAVGAGAWGTCASDHGFSRVCVALAVYAAVSYLAGLFQDPPH